MSQKKFMMNKKVLFVASEAAPIVKVGGLADVIGSLPKALKKLGVDVSIVLPFYSTIKLKKRELILENLWKTNLPESNIPVFLIENKNYFKDGIYVEADASSGGSEKEAKRFLFFSLSAIKLTEILKPDILHCHDWHTAIVASLLRSKKIKTLLTIHNLGYQGIYSSEIVNQVLGTNFSGEVNCLREGILSADFINTVSENYAKEILTPEYGYGLEKELQKRKNNLVGILNGLDEEQFNPEKDPYLKTNYSIETLDKKLKNKIFLQKNYFGKVAPEIPVLGMVSRLAQQKGFDLIKTIFPILMEEKLQFILLGKGMKEYEDFFQEKSRKYPGKFLAKIQFNEELAHQIYAGSDIFLMPSLFEPCGLGQMISMKYGTLPLVRATGGLKDTVTENTGFLFEKYEGQEFLKTIRAALKVFKNKRIWQKIQKNGMRQNFSWQKSAKKYLEVYQKLI